MPVFLAVVVFLVSQMATLFGRKGHFIKLSHCNLCHNLPAVCCIIMMVSCMVQLTMHKIVGASGGAFG